MQLSLLTASHRTHLGTYTQLAAGSRHHWHAGKRAATLVAAGIFACQSARLPARDLSESQPQHVRQLQNPWNFARSFGNPGCCGWDTRAPFHLGNTPSKLRRFRIPRCGF